MWLDWVRTTKLSPSAVQEREIGIVSFDRSHRQSSETTKRCTPHSATTHSSCLLRCAVCGRREGNSSSAALSSQSDCPNDHAGTSRSTEKLTHRMCEWTRCVHRQSRSHSALSTPLPPSLAARAACSARVLNSATAVIPRHRKWAPVNPKTRRKGATLLPLLHRHPHPPPPRRPPLHPLLSRTTQTIRLRRRWLMEPSWPSELETTRSRRRKMPPSRSGTRVSDQPAHQPELSCCCCRQRACNLDLTLLPLCLSILRQDLPSSAQRP